MDEISLIYLLIRVFEIGIFLVVVLLAAWVVFEFLWLTYELIEENNKLIKEKYKNILKRAYTKLKNRKKVTHAKWINHGSFVECSNCHEEQYGVDNFRFYCAHCGAKMDKE